MTDGPRISVADVIRSCGEFRQHTLDLGGLPVTDQDLATIPETVVALGLMNAPVTDRGISHLSRLVRLKRLNIAGTRITDAGLVALETLPQLEWVCLTGTQVTATAVNHLQGTHPNLAILTGPQKSPLPATELLAKEMATFRRELPQLIAAGEEGRWALVQGENINSTWGTLAEAIEAGDHRFGLTPFLVEQVLTQPRTVRVKWPVR